VHLREQFDHDDHSEKTGPADGLGRRVGEEEEEAGVMDGVAGRTRMKKPRFLGSETREGNADTTLSAGIRIIRKCMAAEVEVRVKTEFFILVVLFFFVSR